MHTRNWPMASTVLSTLCASTLLTSVNEAHTRYVSFECVLHVCDHFTVAIHFRGWTCACLSMTQANARDPARDSRCVVRARSLTCPQSCPRQSNLRQSNTETPNNTRTSTVDSFVYRAIRYEYA